MERRRGSYLAVLTMSQDLPSLPDSYQEPTAPEAAPTPVPIPTSSSDRSEDTAKLLQALKDAKPSWQEDGLGIRGIPVVVTNTKANLNWDPVPVFRRPVLDQP